MPTLSLTSGSPGSLTVDALVVGVAKGGPTASSGAPARRPRRRRKAAAGVAASGPTAPVVVVAGGPGVRRDLDRAFRGRLTQALTALGATGAAGEVTKVSTLGAVRAPVLVAVGLGEERRDEDYDAETLRRAAGAAARALAGTERVGLALPAAGPGAVAAVAEGALLGAYAFSRYRTVADGQRPPVAAFTLSTDKARDKAVQAKVARAVTVVDSVNLARDLVNTPPSDLHPRELADAAATVGRNAGLHVHLMDEEALRAGGYGGILGVGQGSVNPPRLVKLSYSPRRIKAHLALVGKGITFDSGGLSLKPAQAMEWMKADMGGAAAVIAAIVAIARLELPLRVTAWAPMAENMPSGNAQRPSDVLTTYGGRTVEVLNTDAEGRLILADALVAAGEERPDLIVDAATLTGAQLVALGSRTSAIMSNDEDVRDRVHNAAQRAGEAMWPMPLPEELRKSMDSEVADIANMGDKYGGMLVAGLFLQEFVGEGLKWAHLDIAGPAFNEGKPYGYTPKGGTGAAVRTLVQIAEDLAAAGR